MQLLEKETLRTEDLPRLDLRKLTAHKRAPHNVGGQAVAPARDGDEAGAAALSESSLTTVFFVCMKRENLVGAPRAACCRETIYTGGRAASDALPVEMNMT